MSLKQRLENDQKAALKSGDRTRLNCLRMLRSKVQEREVALRGQRGREHELDDEEAVEVIASYAKQRRDSIESYRQASRDDLVAKEEAELAIVNEYLPRPLDDDELRRIVAEAVAESGATSAREMGAVMKLVMPRVKGAADGKKVQQLVREVLQ